MVGYASGDIPRIPLNLVLLKGIHILGFQFVDFAGRLPDELRRNEAELDQLLAEGRVAPHVEKVLGRQPGVAHAAVNLASKKALLVALVVLP